MSTFNKIQLSTENLPLTASNNETGRQRWCIHHLIETQAEQTPNAPAILFESGQLTYQELNEQANQLAHHLHHLGVGPEIPVAICVERSPEMIVGLLGILKAGGIYMPLDPAYPDERLAFMLADSQAPILLTQNRLAATLPKHQAKLVRLDGDWPLISRQRRDNPINQTLPDHLAYIIYTSGSTGQPKGVMISHRSLASFSEMIRSEYELKPTDRVMQFASISFDTAVEEIYPCLIGGGALALRPELASISGFLQKCQDWSITILDLPTAYWHQLTTALSTEKLDFPASIRLVIIGGEKALSQQFHLWQQRVGRRARLLNTYGPTETTVVATSCDLTTYTLVRDQSNSLPDVPIGRPLPNSYTYILTSTLQPVSPGTVGELFIGGDGLARGYLDRPDLTADRFVPDPFSSRPGGRVYRTGDLVRSRGDGNLEFVGRVDHQVKVRGYRIELGEIEEALRQHPAVQQAVVLAWDIEHSFGDKRLAAYVVAGANSASLIGELRRYLADKLPYYMTPSAFFVLEKLPMTPNGKIDRRALPAPDKARPELATPYRLPRTSTETELASLWANLLELDRVGIDDDFIELGGHSLLATRLASRIRDLFQLEVPLNYLFEAATIANLAQHIDLVRQATQVLYRQQTDPHPVYLGEGAEIGGKRDEGEL